MQDECQSESSWGFDVARWLTGISRKSHVLEKY